MEKILLGFIAAAAYLVVYRLFKIEVMQAKLHIDLVSIKSLIDRMSFIKEKKITEKKIKLPAKEKKRKYSEESRKRISEASKKRWAQKKASKILAGNSEALVSTTE